MPAPMRWGEACLVKPSERFSLENIKSHTTHVLYLLIDFCNVFCFCKLPATLMFVAAGGCSSANRYC